MDNEVYKNGNRSIDEASNIRNFYKVQVACAELQQCMKTLYECGVSNRELDEMATSASPVDVAIANSPAMRMAANLEDVRDPFDVLAMLEYFQFNPESNPVDDFIFYPVISDPKLENLAFIHRSYPNMDVKLSETEKTIMSNERLEFLGDSWLGAFVAHICYKKYPFADEGALSMMKSAIVNNGNLARLSEMLGFKERLKANIPKSKMKIKDKVSKHFADCVEAYIGALVVDRFGKDLQEIEDWIEALADEQFNSLGDEMLKKPLNRNAKGELAELFQFNTLNEKLVYEKLTDSSPFRVRAMLGPNVLAEGEGHNIREAEQRAAMAVLEDHALLQQYCPFELEDNIQQQQYTVEENSVEVNEEQETHIPADYPTRSTHVDSETIVTHTVEEIFPEESHMETSMPTPSQPKSTPAPAQPVNTPAIHKINPNVGNPQTTSAKPSVPKSVPINENDKENAPAAVSQNGKRDYDEISDITDEVMGRLSSMLSELVTSTVAEVTQRRKATRTADTTQEKGKPVNVQVTEEAVAGITKNAVIPETKEPSTPTYTPADTHTTAAATAIPVAAPKATPAANPTTASAPSASITSKYAKLPYTAPPFVPKSASKSSQPTPEPHIQPKPAAAPQAPANLTGEAVNNQAAQRLYAIMGSLKDFPEYSIYQEDDGMFHAVCMVKSSGQVLGEGMSRNKKNAKHAAAANALESSELKSLLG